MPTPRRATASAALVLLAVLVLAGCDPLVPVPTVPSGTTTTAAGATTTTAGSTTTTAGATTSAGATTTTTTAGTTTTTRTTTTTTTGTTTTTTTTATPTTTTVVPGPTAVPPSTAPVFGGDFPDPAVILVDGTYHAFATQTGAVNVQRITSTDLVTWVRPAQQDALQALPYWADSLGTWAPEPFRLGSRFVLFYTVHQRGGAECISTATATSIDQQFVDTSSGPLVCQPAGGGSIDPSPYTDTATGDLYLAWKTNDSAAATLFSRRLRPDATGFAAAPAVPLLRSTGLAWTLGNIEGPTMVDTGRGWLLFYSANVYTSAAYGIGYATCDGPQGPCTNTSTTGPWVGSHGRAQGPGGQSVFVDVTGRLVMAYHAWDRVIGYDRGGARTLWLDALDVSSGAPVFTG